MKKVMHLISNAHIDPVWQWEWEEGAAETISTFRCASKFCREFDGYIFCHNEALLYRWIEEYEPSLFKEIMELVRLGKWHIMGGWYLQPDCNMPSGEGIIRNINEGRNYFDEKFGKRPTTAINFDPFGHSRGLVQILAKSGFDSYLFCRPDGNFLNLPKNSFTWVGYDDSKVVAYRSPEGYGTGLGHSVDKMRTKEAEITDLNPLGFCLWGVGDHGGGPSRIDLQAIDDYIRECAEKGIKVKHSTPEAFFDDLKSYGIELPEIDTSLNPWAVGCYTSQVRVKQKYREAENMYLICEKMCSTISCQTDFLYPKEELHEALLDILTAQFHDALPGSSVQAVEEMVVRKLDHALEILSRIRMRAFIMLCRGQKRAKNGEIPVICFNPHPYPVTDDFYCEFMLSDQNWSGTFMLPEVFDGETKMPSQCEKEASNIPLDWRKRAVFHATLQPMSIKRFDVRLKTLEAKPIPMCFGDDEKFLFESSFLRVLINKKTGLIDSIVQNGTEYVKANSFALDVVKDDCDPWGMRISGFYEKIGEFKLCSGEEASKVMDLDVVLPSVHVVESGDVRTVIEAVFEYSTSRAIVRYILSKTTPSIKINLRLINNEKSKLIRLAVPHNLNNATPILETIFGEESMKTNGDECVGQKYLKIVSGNGSLGILNRGTYGSSYKENVAYLTLLRGAGYTCHPLGPQNPLPQDRYTAHMDQGERLFDFEFIFGDVSDISRKAQVFNEVPMVLSFFPDGTPSRENKCPVIIENSCIIMTALKKADDDDGFVIRLFNPSGESVSTHIKSEVFNIETDLTFGKYEVKCFRIKGGKLIECDLTER